MAKKVSKTQIDQFQLLTARKARPKLVAHLLNRSVRWLRDADIPMNADGTYDLRVVLKWAEEHLQPASVSDDDLERILRATDFFRSLVDAPGWSRPFALRKILEHFNRLQAKHGSAAFTVFGREFHLMFQEIEAEDERKGRGIEPDEWRRFCDLTQDGDDDETVRERLQGAVKCEICGRFRNGRSWNKRKGTGDIVCRLDRCPDCLKEHPWE